MKILHTADWHLGQTFYEFDRSHEHKQFLDWLVKTISDNQIELLLISGDVFDVSNPSSVSVTMFYTFLRNATKANPELQIIVIAGNHDSPQRLEAPKPLLDPQKTTIVGLVEKDSNGNIDNSKLTIPIKNKNNETIAWCIAVPYLRNGDYPIVPDSSMPYTDGVAKLFSDAYSYAATIRQQDQAILAMGHLHTAGAEISELDKSERLVIGGAELIPASVFNGQISYTALGHLHRAQKIGGKENIRYAGSPLPMSFSESNYNHQVVIVEIEGCQLINITPVMIPVCVPLKRIPIVPKPIDEVIYLLQQLPIADGNKDLAPYIEVRVLLEGPEPALRYQIEKAMGNKFARLAKIDVHYPVNSEKTPDSFSIDDLNNLKPMDVFKRHFKNKYDAELPEDLLVLFNETVNNVTNSVA